MDHLAEPAGTSPCCIHACNLNLDKHRNTDIMQQKKL